MKKAIIVGTFTFVGYELCCRLLDNEINVVGIDTSPSESSIEEEKMLRIGRNANFKFVEQTPLVFNQTDTLLLDVDTVFYPLNDPYSTLSRDFQSAVDKAETILKNTIGFCERQKSKLILISSFSTNQNIDGKIPVSSELDTKWYDELELSNSHLTQKITRYNNLDFLISYIDLSKMSLQDGKNAQSEYVEWVREYL